MVTTHNLGFPRIGAKRELKFALEDYWKGNSSRDALTQLGGQLRQRHWQQQAGLGLDLVPVGDFSFYDQVLDMSFMLAILRPGSKVAMRSMPIFASPAGARSRMQRALAAACRPAR